jgi:hypothetical protein
MNLRISEGAGERREGILPETLNSGILREIENSETRGG